MEYEKLICGTAALQDHIEHGNGPGLGMMVCTAAALELLTAPQYITADIADRCLEKGKEYFRLTENAAKQTEADIFKKKHVALNEQLKTLKQIFVSSQRKLAGCRRLEKMMMRWIACGIAPWRTRSLLRKSWRTF